MKTNRRRSEERDGRGVKRARQNDDSYRPVSEAEILRLVSERESLRQSRSFAESDAIREELRSLGVEINDKDKEWRCKDGRRGRLFTAGPGECRLDDAEIQDRIMDREEARRSKDFDLADRIRSDLRSLGVELNDKEMTWRTSSGRSGGYSGGYSGGSLPTGPDSTSEIRALVCERERYRAAQDFQSADDVRRQLAQMGVELFDSERFWRASDGTKGVIISGGHDVDCELDDDTIYDRIAQREEARSHKDFDEADDIRDELRRNGVELVDAQKSWITTDGRSGSYQAPRPSRPVSSARVERREFHGQVERREFHEQVERREFHEQVERREFHEQEKATLSEASIIALVAGRERARNQKDWQDADAIRSDLRSFGVEVWDKDKVWRARDGRHGPIRS